MILKVITLHQPYATWIALGWKTIETRLHNKFKSLKGQTIGIHASLKYDIDAFPEAIEYMRDEMIHFHTSIKYPQGAIVCTAFVKDFRALTEADSKNSMIECFTPRYGLVLENIVKCDPPIRAKGMQGIWTYNFKTGDNASDD